MIHFVTAILTVHLVTITNSAVITNVIVPNSTDTNSSQDSAYVININYKPDRNQTLRVTYSDPWYRPVDFIWSWMWPSFTPKKIETRTWTDIHYHTHDHVICFLTPWGTEEEEVKEKEAAAEEEEEEEEEGEVDQS